MGVVARNVSKNCLWSAIHAYFIDNQKRFTCYNLSIWNFVKCFSLTDFIIFSHLWFSATFYVEEHVKFKYFFTAYLFYCFCLHLRDMLQNVNVFAKSICFTSQALLIFYMFCISKCCAPIDKFWGVLPSSPWQLRRCHLKEMGLVAQFRSGCEPRLLWNSKAFGRLRQ